MGLSARSRRYQTRRGSDRFPAELIRRVYSLNY
nr:MAG TPA: hypothetical protein [Caudoviricetes sp.]